MAYQSTKPLSTDLLSQSQSDIATNFTEIKTLVDVNHETFGSAAGQGKHFFVQFPLQTVSASIPPQTLATEFGIYNKLNSAAAPALWIKKPGDPAGSIDPTKNIDFTTATLASPGTAPLPCGLIMKWGTSAVGVGDNRTITYTTPFPTATLNVQATPINPGAGSHSHDFYITPIDRTSFQLHWNNAYAAYWFAIGY